jgi:ubiquinone/menaquinone biosynthesis C-methylase UbiE
VGTVDTPEALRQFGQVFDHVAEAYDEVRSGYPAELVDTALVRGGLETGARVLEVGCGTGKLTELLAARGLTVDAVDPGPNMIEAARRRVGDGAPVRFHVARFEDVDLPTNAYAAVFSATAFHWIDPAVAWHKSASHLEPGGLIALLMHRDVHDESNEGLDAEFRALLQKHAPQVAETLSPNRDLESILAGVEERRGNASAVWDWLMGERRGLAVSEAADLFTDVEVVTRVENVERTADELIAHFRTTSLYFQIDPAHRAEFEAEDRRNMERRGGILRFREAAVLMTALRA